MFLIPQFTALITNQPVRATVLAWPRLPCGLDWSAEKYSQVSRSAGLVRAGAGPGLMQMPVTITTD